MSSTFLQLRVTLLLVGFTDLATVWGRQLGCFICVSGAFSGITGRTKSLPNMIWNVRNGICIKILVWFQLLIILLQQLLDPGDSSLISGIAEHQWYPICRWTVPSALWPVFTCMFLAGLCVAQRDHNVPSSYISNLSSFPCCQLTFQNAKFWITAAEHHQLCTDSVPTLDCCLLRCITDCRKWLNFSIVSMIFCVRLNFSCRILLLLTKMGVWEWEGGCP